MNMQTGSIISETSVLDGYARQKLSGLAQRLPYVEASHNFVQRHYGGATQHDEATSRINFEALIVSASELSSTLKEYQGIAYSHVGY